jgi:hypothetical protein
MKRRSREFPPLGIASEGRGRSRGKSSGKESESFDLRAELGDDPNERHRIGRGKRAVRSDELDCLGRNAPRLREVVFALRPGHGATLSDMRHRIRHCA